MTVEELLRRARRTLNSAKLLLTAQAPAPSESIRTHSGLISAFSLHLVKTGQLSIEIGKSLSKVSEIRLVADYSDEDVTPADASWVVAQSATFLTAISELTEKRIGLT